MTDTLLAGRIVLRQPATGHRAGTDAVLLAAAGPADVQGQVVDLGSGVGTVGIAYAVRNAQASLVLAEIDAKLVAMAAENLRLNGLEERGRAVAVDVQSSAALRRAAGMPAGQAGLVLTNPPFDPASHGRPSPDPARRLAHVMDAGGFHNWFAAAADALRHRGQLVAIVRADAVADVLAALSPRLGSLALLPVHPRRDAAAKRLLVRAVKGGRAPTQLLPGFVLHRADGRFTDEAEAVHRGEVGLDQICAGW